MLIENERLMRRLLARSTPMPTGCRFWNGAKRGGYGRLWNGEAQEDTHRMAYRVFKGPIPAGKCVCHTCDEPSCVEPSHLWLGTMAENMADRDAKGRGGGWKNKGRKRPGTGARGSNHPKAKLTHAEALMIQRYHRNPPEQFQKYRGLLNVCALARHLGVSDSLVRGVIAGRNWAWVE